MKNQAPIEEFDASVDADVEQSWIEDAQRRYDAYLKGDLEALPGDDVMARAYQVTEAMNHASDEIVSENDTFTANASRRILERTKW